MKIVVYANTTCSYCKALRDYFSERHIEYQEKNISEDVSARMTLISQKILAIPAICIDDKDWIVGYQPANLDKYFDTHPH